MSNERLTPNQLARLKDTDFNKIPGFENAESIIAKQHGETGSPEREEFDAKAMAWYYGEVLKTRRKEIGMTQQQLADEVGCQRTYLSRIEKGETDIQLSSFIRIARALGLKFALI